MKEHQEKLDLVDENDRVIGNILRGDYTPDPNSHTFIRFTEAFIQRPDGAIWLPRRSQEKRIAPGGLDLSIAGHVLSGESYEESLVREAKEEASLEIEPNNITPITLSAPSSQNPYFRKLFLIATDLQPTLSPEHTGGEWVKVGELEDYIKNDVPTKESLLPAARDLMHFLSSD